MRNDRLFSLGGYNMKNITFALAGAAALVCVNMPSFAADADAIAAAMADPDRAEWELERDGFRHPDLVLAHLDIGPGDRVADLGAGGGYFTHLVANLVGPDGHVYGQNPQAWVDNYGANWPEQHGNLTGNHPQVEMITAPFDALGFEPGSLDAVTLALIYHDIPLLGVERSAAAASIYDALRPGGLVLITDHHTPDGGDYHANADNLHRGNEAITIADMQAAGFTLVGSYDDLENEDDDMTLMVFNPEIRGQTSRFILVFQKPE